MSTRYVENFTGPVTTSSPGWGDVLPNATPIGYDKTRDALVFEDETGVIRVLSGAQVPTSDTTASRTLTPSDSGRTFIATAASGTQTYILPTAASFVGTVTFICGNAAGEILVNPNAADQLSIKGLVDHSTSVKPAAGTGVKNTAGSNVLGDHLTLRSDGLLTWHEVAGAGIWETQ